MMIFFNLVLTPLCAVFFYEALVVVIGNLYRLTDPEIFPQIGTYTLTLLFLLPFLKRYSRSYVIHDNVLEVKTFSGLSRKTYDFKNLRFSYSSITEYALLELPNGEQLALRPTQYLNFHEMVGILRARIQNAQMKLTFVNRMIP